MVTHFTYEYIFKINSKWLTLSSKTLISHESGLDGTLEKYRLCNERWRITGMNFFTHVFTGSGSLLVCLIVLLRLLMVRKPTNYEGIHESMSRTGCILIWVVSLLLPTIAFVLSLPDIYDPDIFNTMVNIEVHALLTVPILLTVLIYAVLLWTVHRHAGTESRVSNATRIRMRAFAKMTHGIVIGLIVCNVPGLMFFAYFTKMIEEGKTNDVYKSLLAVRTVR